MAVFLRPIIILISFFVCISQAQSQIRVATYNIADFDGDVSAALQVIDEISMDDHDGTSLPLSILITQECTSSSRDIISKHLESNFTPGTFTQSGSVENAFGAQALWYRTNQFVELVSEHKDAFTGAGRDSDRWTLRLLGYQSDRRVTVISTHLKAGTGSDNIEERLFGVNQIMEVLVSDLPLNRPVILGGDFNLYSNSEPAYQKILQDGYFIDPLGFGSWGGASSAHKHTQSPLGSSSGGLIGGGMDDRFDFLFVNSSASNNEGLSANFERYKAFGNDGEHYNDGINEGNNFYFPNNLNRSNELADLLAIASDHIPVRCDFTVPSNLNVTAPFVPLGPVIDGADFAFTLLATNNSPFNSSNLVQPANYSISVSGTTNPPAEGILNSQETTFVLLNSPTVTQDDPFININIEDLFDSSSNYPTVSIPVTVLDHSNFSFSSTQDINFTQFKINFENTDSAFNVSIPVFNYLYNDTQALLSVKQILNLPDGINISNLPQQIGLKPRSIVLKIEPSEFSVGNTNQFVQVLSRDQEIPGASDQTGTIAFQILVGNGSICESDIAPVGGDGSVDTLDLLEVISNFGGTSPVADINSDGVVDTLDLLLIITNFGEC